MLIIKTHTHTLLLLYSTGVFSSIDKWRTVTACPHTAAALRLAWPMLVVRTRTRWYRTALRERLKTSGSSQLPKTAEVCGQVVDLRQAEHPPRRRQHHWHSALPLQRD
ncbi:unnamed protein product [Ectocarpus sp. 12 AP-2014]